MRLMMLLSCIAFSGCAYADSELVITIIGYLVTHAGSFGWVEWSVLGAVVLHFVALVVVNLTPTPADNLMYGKLYRYLLEPIAGVVSKRVKQ